MTEHEYTIELRPQKLWHAITNKPVPPAQYEILIDGIVVGVLPFHEGASPLLTQQLGPLELRAMMRYLIRKLHPHPVGQPQQPPTPPKPTITDDDYLDPFESFESDEADVSVD